MNLLDPSTSSSKAIQVKEVSYATTTSSGQTSKFCMCKDSKEHLGTAVAGM